MKFNNNHGINWLRFAGILALCSVMQPTTVRSQPAPIANIPQLSTAHHKTGTELTFCNETCPVT